MFSELVQDFSALQIKLDFASQNTLGAWLGPLTSALGSAGGWRRETEQRSEFPTPVAVGEGSPPPSPSHSSGEGETGSPDFQGYLKAAQTSSVYYLCQTAALDNSLRSTLILMLEVFRIKKEVKTVSVREDPSTGLLVSTWLLPGICVLLEHWLEARPAIL